MTSWREQLAFAPLENGERGEAVGERLRHAIELGVLEDGTQLPSENELAAKMGVSTLTLRTALAELRHRGLIETRRGKKGGSFVRANTEDIARARQESLAAYSLEDLRDIREYRAVLAGSAATAAADGTARLSMSRLSSMAGAIAKSQNVADATRADSRFHIELAAISRSVRLMRQEMVMQSEVGFLVWADHVDKVQAASEEHLAIVDAIREGDAVRARMLAEDHVRGDMNRIMDQRMAMESPALERVPGIDTEALSIASIKSFASTLYETVANSLCSIEQEIRANLKSEDPILPDLTKIYDVSRGALEGTVPLLYGMGFMTDPLYFGHTSLAWCYSPAGPGSIRRLDMDMDYFDFSTAPGRPRDDADEHSIHTSYAYVDASGTNENVITFTKKVSVEGRTVGVIGADVLVSQLQTRFEPFLRALPMDTCVIDQNGIVIATNTGRLIGGTYQNNEVKRIPLEAVPWQLCLGASAEKAA